MEELLQELFGLMPEGTFVDIEEFKTFIEEDGTDDLFDLFKPGTFEDEEQFNQYIEPLKKKRFSASFSYPRYGIGYDYARSNNSRGSIFIGIIFSVGRFIK